MVNTQTIYRFCMSGKIKKQGLPFFIVPYLIGLCFLNCSAQQSYTHMDLKYLKENGEYIHYHVLPEKKDINISLIADEQHFLDILKRDGQDKISRDALLQIGIQRKYNVEGFFLSHCSNAEVYHLENGLFLADQHLTNKANPYFIAASLEDILLVFAYVTIFHDEIDSTIYTFVKSSLHNHQHIYNFLTHTELRWDEEKSTDIEKIFVAQNGQHVVVRYSKKRGNRTNVSPSHKLDNHDERPGIAGGEFYHSAVIYQSMKDMQLLGIFEEELDDIDESNFPDYATNMLTENLDKIPVKIFNSQGKLSSAKLTKEPLEDAAGNDKLEIYRLNADKVYQKYNDYLFVEYKNVQDLLRSAKKSGFPDFAKLSLELFDAMLNTEKNVAALAPIFKPASDSGSYEKVLRRLDQNINQFFFDDYFINQNFVSICIYLGKLAEQKGVGKFVYDKTLRGWVIVTPKGNVLNFTPYLFEEMLRQKYTSKCLTESIMGGLLAADLLKVVPR